jgi:hypothetical protein
MKPPVNDNQYYLGHVFDDDPDDIYDDYPSKQNLLFYLVPLLLGSIVGSGVVTALYIVYMFMFGI